jgi:hypothetical protein
MKTNALQWLAAASIALSSSIAVAESESDSDDTRCAPETVAFSGTLPYPNIADTTHASRDAARFFRSFFTAKSEHNPTALMQHFSLTNAYYIDASSGSVWPSWTSLNAVFNAFLPPAPPTALSYPVRILGDTRSAIVFFTDTPQLFGRELRIMGSVTFDDTCHVIRWMDYWDGRSSGYEFRPINPSYPTDFRDSEVNASPTIRLVAQKLQQAFSSGDVATAAAMFSNDSVYEDMALHAQVLGQIAIKRYLTRALAKVPYGPGASLAHVVGSSHGGGYEWVPATSFVNKRGNLALELDDQGDITRLTVMYDSSLIPDTLYHSLVDLSAEQ